MQQVLYLSAIKPGVVLRARWAQARVATKSSGSHKSNTLRCRSASVVASPACKKRQRGRDEQGSSPFLSLWWRLADPHLLAITKGETGN